MPFSAEEIESIRADCFANDVDCDLPGLENCTEDQLIEYFESGGEALPPGVEKRKKSKKKKAPAPPVTGNNKPGGGDEEAAEQPKDLESLARLAVPERRGKVQGLLCLHAAASSGKIMQKQLRPLGLEAALNAELHLLDGELAVEPDVHKDAKILRAFYPAFANRQYMELYEEHERSGEERPVLLVPTRTEYPKEDRPLNLPTLDQPPGGMPLLPGMQRPDTSTPWTQRYRGVEAALTQLARALAKGPTPAARLGVVAHGQGAHLLTMLLALVQAADDGRPLARRRRDLLWPSSAVLFAPSTRWAGQLADDPKFAARALAAIDAGIAQADASSAGEAAGEGSGAAAPASAAPAQAPASNGAACDISDGAANTAELPGVFSRPIMLPVLVVVGQLDPGFEAGRETGMKYYAHARMAMHENGGANVPQDDEMGKLVAEFLRGSEDGEA